MAKGVVCPPPQANPWQPGHQMVQITNLGKAFHEASSSSFILRPRTRAPTSGRPWSGRKGSGGGRGDEARNHQAASSGVSRSLGYGAPSRAEGIPRRNNNIRPEQETSENTSRRPEPPGLPKSWRDQQLRLEKCSSRRPREGVQNKFLHKAVNAWQGRCGERSSPI